MAKGIVKGIGSGGNGGAIAPEPPIGRPVPPAPAKEKFDRPKPAAIAEISDAGRAALAAAQPPTPPTPGGTMLREMTTGADWDYRLYGPGHAHWGNARQPAPTPPAPSTGAAIEVSDSTTGSDQFQTTSPGHKTVGELAHEAAHVVQQRVRVATGDLDGDGRADVAVNGPPAGAIQNVQKAKHDAMMAAIQNIR